MMRLTVYGFEICDADIIKNTTGYGQLYQAVYRGDDASLAMNHGPKVNWISLVDQ